MDLQLQSVPKIMQKSQKLVEISLSEVTKKSRHFPHYHVPNKEQITQRELSKMKTPLTSGTHSKESNTISHQTIPLYLKTGAF